MNVLQRLRHRRRRLPPGTTPVVPTGSSRAQRRADPTVFWGELPRLGSGPEATRLELYLRDRVVDGTLQEVRVRAHHGGRWDRGERWFETRTGTVWRLILPGPGFGGLFERVSQDEQDHQRRSPPDPGEVGTSAEPTARWDEIHRFRSDLERALFEVYLDEQVADGTLTPVPVLSRLGEYTVGERWFRTPTGVVWRHLPPQEKVGDLFVRVPREEREHPGREDAS